jgi:hypothetical protein
MDSRITVRFYTVQPLSDKQPSFEAALNQILKMDKDKIDHDDGEAHVQGSDFAELKGRISGDLVRLQADNFPSLIEKVGSKPKKLRLAGGGYLGHHTCFLYDTKTKVLAYQYTRNSVSLGRFNNFVAGLCGCEPFGFYPIIKPASLQQLSKMSPKTLRIKIADPDGLEAVEDDHKKLRASLKSLKDLASGMYIKVQIGLGHNKGQLDKGRVRGFVNWLLEQRANEAGGISSIKVMGKDIDDENVPLDFIKAQLGDTEELKLGLTGPDENYKIRSAFITKALDKNAAAIKLVGI